ncbi:XRE family transcriptional regulator [Caproiciproducens sp. NJN-50]|uniref:helix-turn-helix domain-containing protein n=1 Tax=Caproiciproducens sp. NJN-50 TaxID=2507162 RepID=UPI000FFE2908|nr:helix-turn-helix transcriptional regulator [Caproiciproducens sp. NJN-50]QAT48544.1 XRE family transcriptional regulator [Caproiciproducens sp. NJN-50]
MSFSQRLTNLMESKGITPYRMSKDTGIPEATIGRWKNGKAIPNGDMLAKAVKYLETSADFLLFGKEQKNKPVTERDELSNEIIRLVKKLPLEKQKELLDYARYKVDHQSDK